MKVPMTHDAEAAREWRHCPLQMPTLGPHPAPFICTGAGLYRHHLTQVRQHLTPHLSFLHTMAVIRAYDGAWRTNKQHLSSLLIIRLGAEGTWVV
jgi:hypothetical protein